MMPAACAAVLVLLHLSQSLADLALESDQDDVNVYMETRAFDVRLHMSLLDLSC
jgi:hypothetical protein